MGPPDPSAYQLPYLPVPSLSDFPENEGMKIPPPLTWAQQMAIDDLDRQDRAEANLDAANEAQEPTHPGFTNPSPYIQYSTTNGALISIEPITDVNHEDTANSLNILESNVAKSREKWEKEIDLREKNLEQMSKNIEETGWAKPAMITVNLGPRSIQASGEEVYRHLQDNLIILRGKIQNFIKAKNIDKKLRESSIESLSHELAIGEEDLNKFIEQRHLYNVHELEKAEEASVYARANYNRNKSFLSEKKKTRR